MRMWIEGLKNGGVVAEKVPRLEVVGVRTEDLSIRDPSSMIF